MPVGELSPDGAAEDMERVRRSSLLRGSSSFTRRDGERIEHRLGDAPHEGRRARIPGQPRMAGRRPRARSLGWRAWRRSRSHAACPLPSAWRSTSSPTAHGSRSSATAGRSSRTARRPGTGRCATWIAERHGVDPERVFVTNGSLQGFVFLAQRLAPGKRVLVELPTYDRPLKILRELGADVELLACDDEGLDPDALEQALRTGAAAGLPLSDPDVPESERPHSRARSAADGSSSWPTSTTCSCSKTIRTGSCATRGRRCRRSSTSRAVTSSTARRSRRRSRPAFGSAGSCFPEALAREIDATATATYITPVLLGQATVNEFVRRGSFEPNLERVIGLLRARRDAMLAAVDSRSARAASRRGPHGGYFLWLELGGVDASDLLARAEAGRGHLRQGHRLRRPARHRAPGVQLRLARRDRRRRRPARRGAARRGVGPG